MPLTPAQRAAITAATSPAVGVSRESGPMPPAWLDREPTRLEALRQLLAAAEMPRDPLVKLGDLARAFLSPQKD